MDYRLRANVRKDRAFSCFFCLSVLSCIHLLRTGRMREPNRNIIRFFYQIRVLSFTRFPGRFHQHFLHYSTGGMPLYVK